MTDAVRVIDARGHRCPVPSLRLRRALAETPPDGEVRLLADDPMARIDVPHLVQELGAELIELETSGDSLSFLVRQSTVSRASPA